MDTKKLKTNTAPSNGVLRDAFVGLFAAMLMVSAVVGLSALMRSVHGHSEIGAVNSATAEVETGVICAAVEAPDLDTEKTC